VAGIFVLYGAALPAVAQMFLYVGGVLVLLLFTLMLLRRDVAGEPQALSDHRPAAAAVSLAVFAVVALGFQPLVAVPEQAVSVEAVGALLLGPGYLVVFEAVAGLLLVALVAAIALTATPEEAAPAAAAAGETTPFQASAGSAADKPVLPGAAGTESTEGGGPTP
jgi:NADH-quinone oxidoreductase subunit J